jgi:hypothetical protein
MMKNRWAAVGYLLLVFGSGTLVGAVAQRLYTATTVTATSLPKTPAQSRAEFLQKFRKRVGASEDQLVRVNTIMDEAKRKYADLDEKNKPLRDRIDSDRIAAVLALLSPEQQKAYLAWRAEVKAKREQEAAAQKALAEKAAAQNPTSPAR